MPTPDLMEDPQVPHAGDRDAERHVVRDSLEIRTLMRALVRQRARLTVHPDGHGDAFPSALLEAGDDGLLLDGSPVPSINHRVASAGFLLCFAQVDRVMLRFRVERPRQREEGGYVAFQAALPGELYYPQRRGLYRLETDPGDSPWCTFPDPSGGEPVRLRAVDISVGGLAVLLPADQQRLEPRQRHAGCRLEVPGSAPVEVALVVSSVTAQPRPGEGAGQVRVGLGFEDLPRAADAAIQRYIFRVERERRARLGGEG